MKGIVIFDTSHGNTRTIAEAISETLKESGIEVDTFYVKDVKKLSAKDYNFPGSWFANQIWHNELYRQRFFGQGEE